MSLLVQGPERVFGSVTPHSAFIALADGPTTVGAILALLELGLEGASSVFKPLQMVDGRGKVWRGVRCHPGLVGANNVTGSFRAYLLEHRVGADLTDDATELIVHRAGDLTCVAANRTFGGTLLPATYRPCDTLGWTATDYVTNLLTDVGGAVRAVSPGSDAVGEFRFVDTWGMSLWFEPILTGGLPASGADMVASLIT